ncbi:MAG: NAD-glutamate dehydrogenase [Nevskia sp.]|nr:NAD-glutamate dehydrogenase [Nevskia sp.]
MDDTLGTASPEHEVLIAQLDGLAAGAAESAAFRRFLRTYVETASLEVLRRRSPAELFEVARGHWRFAARRNAGEILLRLLPPAADSRAALATVETCVEDQPFLVDSLSLAIRNAGANVAWLMHPLLRLQRDAQGRLQDVLGVGVAPGNSAPSAQGAPETESLIHLEFEPLASAEAYAQLETALRSVLADLRVVVADYAEVLKKARALSDELQQAPPGADAADFAEARDFLAYLAEHHFTFLGYVETHAQPLAGGTLSFRTQRDSGLGLLRPASRWADEDLIAPQSELDKYTDSPRLVVVTKANLRSPIHRDELMDVVSVKRFDASGAITGTVRFVGLFSSEVYIDRPRHIPLIRRKALHVMQRSRLPETSHSGKSLRDILHQLPRDELFQSSEDELYRLCLGIRALRDYQQLRVFVRRDRYGRFFSCLVYLPRDRYSRELRDKLGATLLEIYRGTALDRRVEFLRDGLTLVHYIVRTKPGTTTDLSDADVEQRLQLAARSWRDELREFLLDGACAQPLAVAARFADAFPLSYQETSSPLAAAADLAFLTRLSPDTPVLPRLIVETPDSSAAFATRSEAPPAGAKPSALPRATGLKLYAYGAPVTLSDVLPTLENFGLQVIRQEPHEIKPKDGLPPNETLWVQEFEVRHAGCDLSPDAQRKFFESAFLAAWSGEIENDGLNKLVLGAGLSARQVTLLRTICKYLIQTGLPYSQPYMEDLLAQHADIARALVYSFETRFDLQLADAARTSEALKIGQQLDAALDQVASLDGDRVLRAFLTVIRASLRTNYFQPDAHGKAKPYVSLKLDPAMIPELPLPRPMFEVWVYAPQVEGIHLRGGRVARGGLRWSDRRQDFRTEVLGLMKAQMVKNTVIVPVGAKGGFVVKQGQAPTERDAYLANGIECYKTFLRGVLDITDNRVGETIVAPLNVRRYDEDDPYLVVAADKGTATFSDIANGVSQEYGFWLGDAFASGGSAGYDHKKMGITARGAWESVKRHFRELVWTDANGVQHNGKDIQREAFTVVGVGDMSGDVFGNGMLLSPHIRLLAAFDHRHIFLDPNPDAALSFAERQRLFALPRSSWADYEAKLISNGGGVFPRSAKLIKLSEQVRAALDIKPAALTPAELMRAILVAPVDLLWNGGIGTYVKASTQSHPDVGDRNNDAIRVNGRDLRCQVVGEGGNLGCTQLGRIEYALAGCGGAGGRINTDAIDNAGGVHTSDREVNIKIPLNRLMSEQQLTRAARDPLLASFTKDIADFVLRDSYVQSAAISLLERNAAKALDDHAELIRLLEREGLLNRQIEFLPDDDTLRERRRQERGLTRPELAVLIAYSKISLKHAALHSEVPDDPFFVRDLLANFPGPLVERYREDLEKHGLRREIVATILSNALVNRMGAGFAQLWAEDHGLTRAEVLKAYAIAHQIYGGDEYWRSIEALDNQVPAALQYRLMMLPIGLLKHATGWIAGSAYAAKAVQVAVSRFSAPVAELERALPDLLPPTYREDWERTATALKADGVPDALAARLANTRALGGAPDIAELADAASVPLATAAGVYFLVGERFRLLWLYAAINELGTDGKWQALARVNLRDDAYRIHRQLAARILAAPGATPEARIDAWTQVNERHVKFGLARLAELQGGNVKDFSTLAVAVREVRKLRLL